MRRTALLRSESNSRVRQKVRTIRKEASSHLADEKTETRFLRYGGRAPNQVNNQREENRACHGTTERSEHRARVKGEGQQ